MNNFYRPGAMIETINWMRTRLVTYNETGAVITHTGMGTARDSHTRPTFGKFSQITFGAKDPKTRPLRGNFHTYPSSTPAPTTPIFPFHPTTPISHLTPTPHFAIINEVSKFPLRPMTKNLPTTHPAEALEISPEALEVANHYLQVQDLKETADALELPTDVVSAILSRREVKAYIDHVFAETGFNNRYRMRAAMDALIQKKFQEMDEAGVGSNKDILEILALSHKMSMDLLDRQIQLEKIKSQNIKSQVNVQINENQGGSNYANLIERLIKS